MKTLVCFLLVISFPAMAQKPEGYAGEVNLKEIDVKNNNYKTVRVFDNRYQGIKGHPYLYSNWHTGEILLTDNKLIQNKSIKFDSYHNELNVLNKDKYDSVIVDKNSVIQFIIESNNNSFFLVFKKTLLNQKKADYQFMQVLVDGKTHLYKHWKKILNKADYKDPYSQGKRYDEFEEENSYYLEKENGSFVSIKKTKRSVLKTLADQKDKIEQFILDNKIEFKNETDLSKIIEFYNSI